MNTDLTKSLNALFQSQFGTIPQSIIPLPQSGSDRQYYRISNGYQSALGVFNPDIEENKTFFYLTNHFSSLGLNVPSLLKVGDNEELYLIADLGDKTLFDSIISADLANNTPKELESILKKSLMQLAQFQVFGAKELDFSKCYPKSDFDLQSVMWDFNYFKYSFLKPSGIKFNELLLDEDFSVLANILLSEPAEYFHYRDFQSRNVMLVDNIPYFIDYQGGRRGPLLYDVASFLYQAKASFPQSLRDELLDFYLDEVSKITAIDKSKSLNIYPVFVLFRIIQTLGAYGYRGFFERKPHFLQSIPVAVINLMQIMEKLNKILPKIPTLKVILESIYQKFGKPNEQSDAFNGLTLEVNSISLVKGYPKVHPEHGGGFVFDCRGLNNPGRKPEFRMLTGLDKPVADFINQLPDAQIFYKNVLSIINPTVDEYIARGYKHLSVTFGCTGGQHRSVYMANRLANEFRKREGLRVVIKHREFNI